MNKITIPANIPQFDLNCFVVPNLPVQFAGSENGHGCVGGMSAYNMRTFTGYCEACDRLGVDVYNDLEVTAKSLWIQVWIHGLGCDNLTDHGCSHTELYKFLEGKSNGCRRDDLLTGELPEEFLEDAVEGGTKTTYITKWTKDGREAVAKIVWHFDQLPYRYARFGKFEDVVSNLRKRARAYRSRAAA